MEARGEGEGTGNVHDLYALRGIKLHNDLSFRRSRDLPIRSRMFDFASKQQMRLSFSGHDPVGEYASRLEASCLSLFVHYGQGMVNMRTMG